MALGLPNTSQEILGKGFELHITELQEKLQTMKAPDHESKYMTCLAQILATAYAGYMGCSPARRDDIDWQAFLDEKPPHDLDDISDLAPGDTLCQFMIGELMETHEKADRPEHQFAQAIKDLDTAIEDLTSARDALTHLQDQLELPLEGDDEPEPG